MVAPIHTVKSRVEALVTIPKLCGGYWLWAWQISALPKGPKYQMVKTQTESHVRRPIV